ncbi:MAG TPA: RHS repeat-associated core domain-containing protein [Kofleriaceae bacterium]|nr:RHS repeat-associated core domain-containing protein [Kofleriaceae bacterium]
MLVIAIGAPSLPGDEAPSGPHYTPLPDYPANAIAKATAPIRLPGTGSVSDGGASSYAIPLSVPAGPHGMAPVLSIHYTGSTSSNGTLGVGMALAATSTIVPCHRTVAVDGYADGVDYDDTDVYCLDGERLVDFDDPTYVDPTGLAVAVLHTQHESFRRIVAFKTVKTDTQPTRFVVYDQDGTEHEYLPIRGPQLDNEDSLSDIAIVNERIAVAYVLTTTKDRYGNRIEYRYDEVSDKLFTKETAYRLSGIYYSFTGSTPQRYINLHYVTRPDPVAHFIYGIKVVSRTVVDRIEMWAPNPTATQKVWSYQLGYTTSASSGRSLLTSVRLDAQQSAASWTRRFDWTGVATKPDGSLDVREHVIDDVEFNHAALFGDDNAWVRYQQNPDRWLRPNDVRVLLYDIDGDGDDDALYRVGAARLDHWQTIDGASGKLSDIGYQRLSGPLRVRLSSESAPLGWKKIDVTQQLEPGWDSTNLGIGSKAALANLGKSRVVDVNHDGTLDLVLARTVLDKSGEWQEDPNGPNQHWWNIDRWEYGHAFVPGRPFDHFTESPVAATAPAIDEVLLKGPVVRYQKELGGALAWHDPPFQRAYADLDGDGKTEAIDAIRQADELDVLTTMIDWDDPFSYFGASHLYRTTASNHGDDLVFEHNWTCNNGQLRIFDADDDGRQDVFASDDPLSGHATEPLLGFLGVYRKLSLADPWDGEEPKLRADVGDSSKLWGGDCGSHDPDVLVGDWNGDGLADVLYPPGSHGSNTQPKVRINLGTGFAPPVDMAVTGAPGITAAMEQQVPMNAGHAVPWDRGTRVADVDGDGRSDIIAVRQDNAQCVDPVIATLGQYPPYPCENRVVVFRSQGDHFVGEQIWSWSQAGANIVHGFTTAQIGDVNGDGAVDLVHVAAGKLRVLELPWRKTPDRLAAVRDDSTPYPLERFVHTRAWWGDEPRAEATVTAPSGPSPCAWPIACSTRGSEVVRRHDVFVGTDAAGNPRYRSTTHRFAKPRSDLRGAGGLGFQIHETWDRDTGTWTQRRLGDAVPFDPDPDERGGISYPNAGRVVSQTMIIPRLPRPTEAELASPGNAPGLVDNQLTNVRMVSMEIGYETRTAEAGRIVTSLPQTRVVTEVDTQARPQIQSATASYTGAMAGDGRITTVHSKYDDYGKPTQITTEIAAELGGPVVTRRTETSYFHDVAEHWQLGLPLEIVTTSFDLDDTKPPSRVTRLTYTPEGQAKTTELRGRDALYGDCIASGAPPDLCESRSVRLEYEYDTRGNRTTTRAYADGDPTPRVTETDWDNEGVFARQRFDALGFQQITLNHPALGVPLVDVDSNGVTSQATYDGFGRLLTSTHPGTPSLTRTYTPTFAGDRRGMRVDDVFSDGRRSYVESDELGRGVKTGSRVSGAKWSYTTREHDRYGTVAEVSTPSWVVPASNRTTFAYDRLGDVATVKSPDGAITTFERSLLVSVSIDPRGHRSYVHRDVAGRVIESGHEIAGEPFGEVHFGYGPFDVVDRVTDAADNESHYRHDTLGRVIYASDPDVGESWSEYDGFGQLTKHVKPSGAFEYSYDRLGRLVGSVGPDGVETRLYDVGTGAAGKLTRAVAPSGTMTDFRYDALGRLVDSIQTTDGVSRTASRRYDTHGRLRYAFYPDTPGFDRFTVQYEYGPEGRPSAIRDATACHVSPDPSTPEPACSSAALWVLDERDERARAGVWKLGNGTTVEHDHDVMGRLVLMHAGTEITTYDYDDDGNLSERIDVTNNRVEHFDHDELHRLVYWELQPPSRDPKQPAPATVSRYNYDEIGNLTSVEVDGAITFDTTFGWQGRPHLLASSSIDGTFDYDAAGRQVSGGGRTIEKWSQYDLPLRISGAQEREYQYDAFGQRIRRRDADVTIEYVGNLYEHRELAGTTVDTLYVHGETGLVAQVDRTASGSTVRYVISDPLASATHVLDAAGAVSEHAYFDPFGGRVRADGSPGKDEDTSTSFGFGGHEDDGDGLVNMGGRIYDRDQFRFLTADPNIANPLFGQSYNPYSYVHNNPLNLTDPTGLQVVDDDGMSWADDGYDVRTIAGETSVLTIYEPRCAMPEDCERAGADTASAPISTDDRDSVHAEAPSFVDSLPRFTGVYAFGGISGHGSVGAAESLGLFGFDVNEGLYVGELSGVGAQGNGGSVIYATENLYSTQGHSTEDLVIVDHGVYDNPASLFGFGIGLFADPRDPRKMGLFWYSEVETGVGAQPVTGSGITFELKEDPIEQARKTLAERGIVLQQAPPRREVSVTRDVPRAITNKFAGAILSDTDLQLPHDVAQGFESPTWKAFDTFSSWLHRFQNSRVYREAVEEMCFE